MCIIHWQRCWYILELTQGGIITLAKVDTEYWSISLADYKKPCWWTFNERKVCVASLTVGFSPFSPDKMGEEHNVRRTSRIPTFMVVVRFTLLNVSHVLMCCSWLLLHPSLCVLQCILGFVLCSTWKERNLWAFQWSQGIPWLRKLLSQWMNGWMNGVV